MGAMYLTASHMNRRYDDFIRLYHGKKQAHPGNIRNGIHGAYLMEMNLADLHSMSMPLRFCNQTVDCQHILLHLLLKLHMPCHNMFNIVHGGM